MTRRTVRVSPSFFDDLDSQLGESRGPNGEPSSGDFLLVELPAIAELFATRFDNLMVPLPDRPDFRSHLSTGFVVPRSLVTGHLDSKGIITLISVALDLSW